MKLFKNAKKLVFLLFTIINYPSSALSVSDSLLATFNYLKFVVPFETELFNSKSIHDKGCPSYNFVDHIQTERIVYQSTNSFYVSAWITTPSQIDSSEFYPVIVFQHWGLGDKDQFLSEAIGFSQKGFICLLPDAPWNCPNSSLKSLYENGYEIFQQGVMNAMVGLDLIEQQFQIDSSRIFFVGHSYGAGIGAILSAIDKRFKAFVLMAGTPSLTRNYTSSQFEPFVSWRNNHPEHFEQWIKSMMPLDALNFILHKKAPLLYQIAWNDEYISMQESEELIQITPEPFDYMIYETSHKLNKQATRDREVFILKKN